MPAGCCHGDSVLIKRHKNRPLLIAPYWRGTNNKNVSPCVFVFVGAQPEVEAQATVQMLKDLNLQCLCMCIGVCCLCSSDTCNDTDL